MKSLFWKKIEPQKVTTIPKIEEGVSITYIYDKNKYLVFGGVKVRDTTKDQQLLGTNNPATA